MRKLELLDRIEQFCKAVAPELQPHPLYVLPASKLPFGMATSERFYGLTFRGADSVYRGQIGPAWRGRGPVIVQADSVLDSWESAIPIAIHEVAHIVERDEPYCGPVPLDGSEIALKFAGLVAASQADEPTPAEELPWVGHDWTFIRNCCHLAWRAQQLGENISAAAIYTGASYGLSSGYFYARELGDEPRMLRTTTFAAIRSRAPPPAFIELWLCDVVFYFQRTSERRELNMLAILEKIRGKKKELDEERQDRYLAIVNEVAAGENVNEDSAARILADADKSPEDLEKDVQRRIERSRMQTELARHSELTRQRAKHQAALENARAKLAAANEEFSRTAGPAEAAMDAIDRQLGQEDQLRSALRSGCMAPATLAAWHEAQNALAEKRRERDTLKRKASELLYAADSNSTIAANSLYRNGSNESSHMAAATDQRAKAADVEAQISGIDAEIRKLESTELAARAAVELC